jgi:beta-lactam-binding protein with PASTA domain
LTPALVFKPAAPRQHVGIVLAQYPKRGTLSSFDTVRLVVAKPLYGLVPKVVGLRVGKATRRLRKVDLIATVDGPSDGVVVQQLPEAGVAAAPGMHVKVVVRRGSRSASPAADTAKAARSRG